MLKMSESQLINWSILRVERQLRAKHEAEEKALAAAPTDLKKALTWFFLKLRDYHETVELQRTGKGTLLHFVDTRPLATAAIDLAAAVKKDIPELRVSELLHLEGELRRQHGKPEPGEDIDPHLRQRLMDAVALGRELHLLPDTKPDSTSVPTAARSRKRRSQGPPQFPEILGTQMRTRLRRISILRSLPADSNKVIVTQLDEFGHNGPDDSTVSKDIKHMRQGGVIHMTKLELTPAGRRVLKQWKS